MVKNKKKGKKFIDLNIIKNNKNSNKVIDVREYIEDNVDEEEENEETAKKLKNRRRKKIEKNKNKQKEEEILIKDDGDLKEELLTYEETVNPITFKLDKNKDIKNGDKDKNNKIFKSKKSKKEILFKNETKVEEKQEKTKSQNDNFLPPYNKGTNNTNNINEITNKNQFDVNKYNTYKVQTYVKEDDEDSKGSMEEVDKQIKNAEAQTISTRLKFKDILLRRNYNSKKIDYDINKGKIINPCISFDNLDTRDTNINRSNTLNRRKYEKKNSNKDFNFYKNMSHGNSAFGDFNWRCSFSGIQPNYYNRRSKLFQ